MPVSVDEAIEIAKRKMGLLDYREALKASLSTKENAPLHEDVQDSVDKKGP